MKTFKFAPGLELRVIDREGSPWFVAKDVCSVLGVQNTTDALKKHVDADDRASLKLGLTGSAVNIINESGLYSLILKSRKPEAKAFKRWVTSEVLPAIRKNGGYMTPEVAQQAIDSPAVFMANR